MRFTLAAILLLCLPATATAKERKYKPIRAGAAATPITKPPVLPAAKVKDQVTSGELVLGVVVGGHPRAYPVNMLAGPKRGVINDTLAGTAFAATW